MNESFFDTVKGQLGLEDHGGRTIYGVFTRMPPPKLFAMAGGIWHNWQTNAPRKRSVVTYDH